MHCLLVELREESENCGLLSTPPMSSTLVRGQDGENPPISSSAATTSASVSRTGWPFTRREVMPASTEYDRECDTVDSYKTASLCLSNLHSP